jgi:hypothetical protein
MERTRPPAEEPPAKRARQAQGQQSEEAQSEAEEAEAQGSASFASTERRLVGQSVGHESWYSESYLGAQTAEYEQWCEQLAAEGSFQRYELTPFGNFLLSGPKLEWYLCNALGERAKYQWQQTPRFLQAGYPMENQPLLMALVDRIWVEFGERVNQ